MNKLPEIFDKDSSIPELEVRTSAGGYAGTDMWFYNKPEPHGYLLSIISGMGTMLSIVWAISIAFKAAVHNEFNILFIISATLCILSMILFGMLMNDAGEKDSKLSQINQRPLKIGTKDSEILANMEKILLPAYGKNLDQADKFTAWLNAYPDYIEIKGAKKKKRKYSRVYGKNRTNIDLVCQVVEAAHRVDSNRETEIVHYLTIALDKKFINIHEISALCVNLRELEKELYLESQAKNALEQRLAMEAAHDTVEPLLEDIRESRQAVNSYMGIDDSDLKSLEDQNVSELPETFAIPGNTKVARRAEDYVKKILENKMMIGK